MRIASFIASTGDRGATCSEVEERFPSHSHQSVSARIRELAHPDRDPVIAFVPGDTRPGRSGRSQRIYRVIDPVQRPRLFAVEDVDGGGFRRHVPATITTPTHKGDIPHPRPCPLCGRAMTSADKHDSDDLGAVCGACCEVC